MKMWHTALVGAVVGPVIAIPILFAVKPSTESWVFYPVVRSMIFLSRVLFPNQDMGGVVLFLPLLLFYCAAIGAAVALAARLFWSRHSV
jgi:hypothetical protein